MVNNELLFDNFTNIHNVELKDYYLGVDIIYKKHVCKKHSQDFFVINGNVLFCFYWKAGAMVSSENTEM